MSKISNILIGLSVLLSVVLFLIFIQIAFALYPGGNNFNSSAPGHSFWLNFWCDVLAHETLNGVPNPGRPFAVVAGLSLISGLLVMGINSYHFIKITPKVYKVMLSLGILSIITAPALIINHDVFLFITAFTGLTAYMIFLFQCAKSTHHVFFWLGLLAFLTGGLNFILWLQRHQSVFLPIIQKISSIFLLLWMITGSLILLRKPRLS